MIWIRADANSEIGTGHVMRCLSVADSLREMGCEVCFLLADDNGAALAEAHGQEYVILHTDFRRMEEELPALEQLAGKQQPDWCLIDSYFVTAEYLKQVRKLCKTAYMDDKFTFIYPVDAVINYNIYGDLLPYEERYGKTDTRFLLGTSYAPLRKEFRRRDSFLVRETVREVLITTGGSDKYNLAGQLLKAALSKRETADFVYHVVCGVFNQNLPMLQEMAAGNSRICIHQNVTDMKALMQSCDVAITAGGSTMYELCAVGVPILCFSFVDNQERIVQTFADKGLVRYGGNYLTEGEELANHIVQNLISLAENREAREAYSRTQQELVDGYGAERIARSLSALR